MAKTRYMNDLLGHTVGGLQHPAPVAPRPTYAELAESTLDDLIQILPGAEARAATIVRDKDGDIVVFTAIRMFYISGTHVSVRQFDGPAEAYSVEGAR